MSRRTPASTKAQKSQCFFLFGESVAGGTDLALAFANWLTNANLGSEDHQASSSTSSKNTDFFCALVLAGVVLDIREGQPRPPSECFCACPGVLLDIREGQRRLSLRLTFLGERGGVQITTLLFPECGSQSDLATSMCSTVLMCPTCRCPTRVHIARWNEHGALAHLAKSYKR